MGDQTNLVELESKQVTAGQVASLVFNLTGLPSGRRVAALKFRLNFTSTLPSGSSTLFTSGEVIQNLLQFVEHHSAFLNVKATGATLRHLYHHMRGKAQSEVDFDITQSTDPRLGIGYAVIPCCDPRAKVPFDGAIPCELLNGKTVTVKTNALSAIGSTNLSAMNLRLLVQLVPADALPSDPLKTRIDFEDWSGQTIDMKPGTYTHMFAMHSDGSSVETAEVDRVDWQIDGDAVIDNIESCDLAEDFNDKHVSGGFQDNTREQFDPASMPFVPILTPEDRYSILDLPTATKPATAKLTFSGTDTALRIVYRICEPKSLGAIRGAGALQGISGTPERAVKTATGKPISGSLAKTRYFEKVLPGSLK